MVREAAETKVRARRGDVLAEIEKRSAAQWTEARVYEADPEPGREKFFATYPYSYMNAFPHIGHAYTMLRTDLRVRYERAKGKKTLFPFGFHVTGTPIVAAAARVAKKDPVQLRILKESGIPEGEIAKFADPQHWIDFFPDEWRKDVGRFGLAIDWRRSFITTDRNPYYDAFVRWQFHRLKDGGYVRKGRHPVIWDPVENAVIGDHDRAEGEGVGVQEAVLLKFRLEGGTDRFLVAATLRPETVFGQTNLWVDPRVSYQEIQVQRNGKAERWIVSVECADKLHLQDVGIDPSTTYEHVSGSQLVGNRVKAPGIDREIPILPATFLATGKWTGIVTSVPSDAPLDHVALQDLKADPAPMKKCGADPTILGDVRPIEIIETEGLGTLPAQSVVERLGIQNQGEKAKLETATEEVYQDAFYKGKMLAHCKAPDGTDFGGLSVAEAKEAVKAWLLEKGDAAVMYEPEARVVSRHGNHAVVKVVSDQWFVAYGDPEWKKTVHAAIDDMEIHPDVARKQFHIVVDWLKDWACARESGLGTRLPWDEKWVIESLSDSTIYMAYYTIVHHLERLKPQPEDLGPAFWDHVLLGKGDAAKVATGRITVDDVEKMRAEFRYWYPLDFRNSGKDLLQNHLTFAVFNHTAIFPREHWPRGYAVNGWITVDGEKMSKSKGNFITLRDAIDRFGVSATRLAVANAGEGLDDANFEVDFAKSAERRLANWVEAMRTTWDTAQAQDRAEETLADRWFRSRLNHAILATDEAMSRTEYRTALKTAFFDLERDWEWYNRRRGDTPDPALARRYVDTQTRLMTVFVPHLAEATWRHMGNDGFAVDAPYPEAEADGIAPDVEAAEEYLIQVRDDVRSILRLIKKEPERVYLYVAPAWKRRVEEVVVEAWNDAAEGKGVQQGDVIKTLMQDDQMRRLGKEVPQFVARLLKEGRGLATTRGERQGIDEYAVLSEANAFLEREFGCGVTVARADDPERDDPGKKAGAAAPGRPGVYVA